MSTLPKSLASKDQKSLEWAYERLEYPSFAIRLANVVGTPFEMGLKLLPKSWCDHLHKGVENCIAKALEVAISSLPQQNSQTPDLYYKMLGMMTGALGGFLGGPAVLIELPLTTTIMLRSIADIARSEGEDLGSIETRLACIQVFALGGRSREDDAADTGYFGLRLALELPMAQASAFLAQGEVSQKSAPALVNLIAAIAQRFGVTVSEKAAAEFVPIIGAAGGAFINSIFFQHFQDMARSHFIIRRLERKYSPVLIEAAYQNLGRRRNVLALKNAEQPLSGSLKVHAPCRA